MPIKSVTPILNVSSVVKSQEWFEALGWRRGFQWHDADTTETPFGSVCTDGAEVFLCLNGQGSRGTIMPHFPGDDVTDGVWMTWWVENPAAVDAMHDRALALGYIVTCPPRNEPWGVREFHLRHPDGHMFRVSAGVGEA
jgi:catechol 2,3-dioxygenase-like lactoylglutathione lyase family enzyme